MDNVLVTGATGLVGSHLCEALAARGDSLSCLVRSTSKVDPIRSLGAELLHGDLSDHESLKRAVAGQDVVYHVAGAVRSLTREGFHRANEEGVANVAEACAAQEKPPVLVVVSSLAAAGPSTALGRPRTEEDPPAPVSHYGHSKLAGERAARRWADRVPTTIVRPPIIFGPRDPACFLWYRGIRRFRTHIVPGWRQHDYSMIHAADLAQLLILAAHRGERLPPAEQSEAAPGRGIYFADGGQQPTFARMGRMIGRAVGRQRIFIWHMIMPTCWTLSAIVEGWWRLFGQLTYITLDKMREASAGSWSCSGKKAADQLGFAPEFDVQQRMQQTADWYVEQGWL